MYSYISFAWANESCSLLLSQYTNPEYPFLGSVCQSFVRLGRRSGSTAWLQWEIIKDRESFQRATRRIPILGLSQDSANLQSPAQTSIN